MVKILRKETTLERLEIPIITQELRPYLGMSQLGHPCERFLWYTFRWCYKDQIPARVMRLFDRGHREEPSMIKALDSIGIKVFDEQEEMISVHGHVKGHSDGKALGVIEAPKTIHLAEFKTMNEKAFKEVSKEGVKESKPVYYTQTQLYMDQLKLTRALFMAVNKNTDAYYIERIYYDKEHAKEYFSRAEGIILSEIPPPKKFERTWYECKWCSANEICHGVGELEKNCRTCSFVDIYPGGIWSCNQYDTELSTERQRKICGTYSVYKMATANLKGEVE